MQIKEIKSNREFNIFSANIVLNYEELRDLANGLYELCQTEKYKDKASFLRLKRNFSFLFDLVKHSGIDDWSVENAAKVTAKIKEIEAKEGNVKYESKDNT